MFRSIKSRLRRREEKDQTSAEADGDVEMSNPLEETSNQNKYSKDKQQPQIAWNTSMELVRAIRRSLICCCGFWITTAVIAAIVIAYGHVIICEFHKAFCTPLSEYIYRFPMLPKPGESILADTSTVPKAPVNCQRFEPYTRIYPNGKQLLFLIGESRAGSTFSYATLNLHHQIMMREEEPLFSFSNKICNNNPMLRKGAAECNFEAWLKTLYDNAFRKHPDFYQNTTRAKLLGTKINIEQIPTEFYDDLTAFFYCTRQTSVVVHVTRAASIASFWNYQAEVPERINSADFNFGNSGVPAPLNQPLKLDPQLAAEWVHQRDSLSQELSNRLAFGGAGVKYIHYYYEQLHDKDYADAHWNALFAFLGVEPIGSITKERNKRQRGGRTKVKTHGSIPCSERIANWPQVKAALNGTLSALACEHAS